MSAKGTPLDGPGIRAHIQEVADRLSPAGEQHRLIVVGGALLAWHGLRDTTLDVDSLRRIDPELRGAVEEVAARHRLRSDWLNDNAAPFAPATLEEAECALLFDHPRLALLGAPFDQVFLMKLYRLNAQDYEDLVRIWPLCTFTSPEQAAVQFDEAYPYALEDPHLAGLIAGIADEAGRFRGQIEISEDFDQPIPDFESMIYGTDE